MTMKRKKGILKSKSPPDRFNPHASMQNFKRKRAVSFSENIANVHFFDPNVPYDPAKKR